MEKLTKEPFQEIVWTNFYGVSKTTSELDDQHLCNMLWYAEVFLVRTRYNSNPHFILRLEWHQRCNDKAGKALSDGEIERLPWKPLPIPTEIEELRRLKMIDEEGNIIFEGKTIGTITHIENWKDL